MGRFLTAVVASFMFSVVSFGTTHALDIPTAPTLARPIVDQTNTFSAAQIDQLSDQITQSRKTKEYQIAILFIPTLQNTAIEDYSIQVARTWGIGAKDKDDGILLLVAKNDHKMRIEVGRGVEDELTDLESGRIIRNILRPAFRGDDYYGGVSAAIAEIQNNMEGQPTAQSQTDSSSVQKVSGNGVIDTIMIAAFFIVPLISWFVSMLARSKSWWMGGVIGGGIGATIMFLASFAFLSIIGAFALAAFGLLLDYVVSHNYRQSRESGSSPSWWAGGPWIGGGGGGWSGGGGGGFGGGGFGGGGSSGSW